MTEYTHAGTIEQIGPWGTLVGSYLIPLSVMEWFIETNLPLLSQNVPPNPSLQLHLNFPPFSFMQTPLFLQGLISHG